MTELRKFAVPVVLLALVVAGVFAFYPKNHDHTLTAEFPRTISIYQGSDVRVLGVPVGKVTKITPDGTYVAVTMSYDQDIKLPSDAKAVIVAPSIVGDRFVQLTPVYTGGPTLKDGATLDVSDTAVPVELDQVYSSIDQLTVALGPDGANKNGSLSALLDTTAENFGGEGAKFHQTIKDFGKLSKTLDDNKDELFGSAKKLEAFINTLAKNDGTVRRFNDSLTAVSKELSGERTELSASLHSLAIGLGTVSQFVKDNRTILGKNIKGLNMFAKVLVKQRAALTETLVDAPAALNNLYLTYNPDTGTLDTNANIGNILNQVQSDPGVVLCTAVNQIDPTGALCNLIQSTAGRTGTFGEGKPTTGDVPGAFDPTLGGLVAVQK